MKPFLKEIAEVLFAEHGNRLNDLCLVFPNRRAGLFFNQYLAGLLKKPVWSPTILTIRELMASLSKLEYADELECITLLYQSYMELRGNTESFDEFFFWGEMLLGDFDETDKYLADARDLFRNMQDLKEIEQIFDYLSEEQLALIRRFWSEFAGREQSREQQHFLEIWNLLLPLYNKFRERLRNQGSAYEGMIYREAAEQLMSGVSVEFPSYRYIFVGFNALTRSEQELFRYFDRSGKGLFYWDYDEFYLENEWHEAGRFIRENLQHFRDNSAACDHDLIRQTTRSIDIYSVPSGSGQTQVLHKILKDLSPAKVSAEETAIILADEELLIPVLQALPERMEEVNVTMGYPVSATPVFSLLEHLINLQQRAISQGRPRYHHERVLAILQHQYVLLRAPEDAGQLISDIQKENRLYIHADQLSVNQLFRILFRKLEKPGEIAAYLLEILEWITSGSLTELKTEDKQEDIPHSLQASIPAMEWEFIYQIYTRIKRLKDLLENLEMQFGLNTFLRIFHKYLQRIRIPFHGEPLRGIQVMGVLETRNLDFNRVIMLSMNEGFFPRSAARGSFIPHHLRLGFGLPTQDHRDAIYAYYFYRLLHRSASVSLLYNNISDGLRTGEKSRYLYQLMYHPGFQVNNLSVGFEVQSREVQAIRISKHPALLNELERCYGGADKDSYLSPSALNTYIDCSLRFYFRYVAGIEEPDEIREQIDHALFGTLLHEVLRRVYEALPDPVTRADLENGPELEILIDRCIDEAFQVVFPAENKGRYMMFKAIMRSYTEQLLSYDKQFTPLQITSLEKEYQTTIQAERNGRQISVRLGGKIDRVDRVNGIFRVIDYKTGSGEMVFRDPAFLFDGSLSNRNRAAFQTLLYSILLRSEPGFEHSKIMPAVYLIRNVFQEDFQVHFGIGTPKKHQVLSDDSILSDEFHSLLQCLLTELFDPEKPFEQTTQVAHCRHCPYRGICQR